MIEINYFYIDKQGIQQGPRSIEQLRNSYVITPDTMVWHQGMAEWRRAADVPDLAGLCNQMPPVNPSYVINNNTYVNKPEPPIDKPHSWLVETILSTLFCCFVFGVIGIIYAAKVDNLWEAGKYEQARSASSTARLMFILSIVGGALAGILYFSFFSIPFLAHFC